MSTLKCGLRALGFGLCAVLLSACERNFTDGKYTGLGLSVTKGVGVPRIDRAPSDVPFTRQDLVSTFRNTAFAYEFDVQDGRVVSWPSAKRLNRWEKPIRFLIEGDAIASDDLPEIQRLLARISRSTGLTFVRVESDHDMRVSIVSKAGRAPVSATLHGPNPEFLRDRFETWSRTPAWICGASLIPDPEGQGEIGYTHIYVNSETVGLARLSCLHEEIAQSLGLTNDTTLTLPSAFNDNQQFAFVTDFDLLLLKILYDPRLQVGMSWTDAQQTVNAIAAELVPEI